MTPKEKLVARAKELGIPHTGNMAELTTRIAEMEQEEAAGLVEVTIAEGVPPEYYPGIGILSPGDTIRVHPSTLPNPRFEDPPSAETQE